VRPRLLSSLEVLRASVHRPIQIVSGYRCPVHNAEVGGAANSQHMYAAAADIPPKLATEQLARAAGFIGIGLSGVWAVHVDVRDGTPVVWRYN
jgi:zinc D-Ala-D-Ala carboxypeptidase